MYTIGKIIGKGGFGYVREAIDKHGNPVAIKYIPKNAINEWVEMNATKVPQEVAFLHKLQNVNGVVKLIDFWEGMADYVIVMERPLLSQDLQSYMTENGPLTERQIKTIFLQILNILTEIHNHGICHRDLKPENILLDFSNHFAKVKIIDFGCASYFDTTKIDDTFRYFKGTRKYAPPEWFSCKTIFAKSSDVWGLGIILFGMLFGNISEECIKNPTLVLPKQIPYEIKTLLCRILERKPLKRISLKDIHCTKWMQRRTYKCTYV